MTQHPQPNDVAGILQQDDHYIIRRFSTTSGWTEVVKGHEGSYDEAETRQRLENFIDDGDICLIDRNNNIQWLNT